MKKLFTLLIAFMLALSFNAMAQWNTYKSIDPSVNNPVNQLKVITIDFDHGIGFGTAKKTLNFTTPDGKTKEITVTDQNPLIIDLGDTYTKPGIYTLSIPKDTFEDQVARTKNAQMTFKWSVVPPPLEIRTVTPTPNTTVQDLSTITISFDAPVEIYGSSKNVTLGGQQVDAVTMSDDGLTATITSSKTFNAGNVTLSIPGSLFQREGTSSRNNAVEYTWNLVKASLGITAPQVIYKGDEANVTLELTNGKAFAGFQLDMVLPNGLEVVEGSYALNADRANGHKLMVGTSRDIEGAIRLLSYALDGKVYTGNEGTLVTFKVKANDTFGGGKIAISNIKFADPEGEKYELTNVVSDEIYSRTYVSSITIAPAELNLETRATAELTVTVAPNDAFNKELEWTSSHPQLVNVDVVEGKVVVTALAETGENAVTITATAKDGSKVTAQIPVTVVFTHATALTITPATVLFEVGNRQTLTATFDKETNKAADIVWTSNKPAVADIVITEGVVEVVGKAIGETTVIAQLKNGNEVVLEKTIPVKVDATLVTEVTVEPNTKTLETGQKFTFNAEVNADATNNEVRWTSSDPSKVSINEETGEVEALALTTEPVVITATAADGGGAKGTAQVTVVQSHATSIVIDRENAELEATGDERGQVKLTATVTPATNKTTIWKSSNEEVATVDANGLVTAIAVGEAEITATIEGTAISATCVVEVLPSYATKVTINYEGETKFETGAGQVTLTATVAPTYVTNNTVTWTSSDEEIAAVANGVVTIGQKPGVVTITAKANGAAEGETVEATINFEVVHTFATKVTIQEAQESIPTLQAADDSKNTFELTATATPATNKDIVWTSSNANVATVDENGKVTAVGVGKATITATIEGTEIADSREITVGATPGDVNNDALVTVDDVNDVALYIIGENLEGFIEAAADVNNDGDIDIADVIRLVNQILAQEPATSEQQAVINRARQYADSSNSLFIENFTIAEGETRQIAIMLNNNAAFSAFQADIYLPEGLEFVEATLSDRKADHSLASRVRVDGSVRLLSYSLGVNAFAGSEGELVYMTVKATDNFVGDFQIEIDNIIFVQPDRTSCYLEPTVADVTGYTGVEGVEDDEIVVKVVGNSIVAPEGAEVYDLNGLRVNAENLAKGIYIVKVGNQVVKVII